MQKITREATSYIRIVGLFLLLSLGLFSSGCVSTVDRVNVSYQLPKNWPRQFEKKPAVGVSIGTFLDRRAVSSPNWLFHKLDVYGLRAHGGGYVAEKPIVEILHDAVASGLIDANFRVEKDLEKCVLTAKILEFDITRIQITTFSFEFRSKLQCEFTLIDNTTKTILWKEIIQSSAAVGFGLGKQNPSSRQGEIRGTLSEWDNARTFTEIWVLSVDKVVMDLITSEEFRRAVVR